MHSRFSFPATWPGRSKSTYGDDSVILLRTNTADPVAHHTGKTPILDIARQSQRAVAGLSMLLSCLLVLLVGCATSTPAIERLPPDDEPLLTQEEQLQRLLELADEMTDTVGKVRGLHAKSPIKRGVKTREELKTALDAKIAEEVIDEEIALEAALYVRLGLMPAGTDLRAILLDVLTEQIAGYYDEATAELYLVEGMSGEMATITMAHELFHAIQDQHFSLATLRPPKDATNSDMSIARTALIEGDASLVMTDYTIATQEGAFFELPKGGSIADLPMAMRMIESQMSFQPIQPDSALSRAPRIVQISLHFPYLAGLRFVAHIKRGRTWQDLNAVYKNPPASSEHILHPERYLNGDMPEAVDFDISALQDAGKTWTLGHTDVLGELGFKLLFEEHLGEGQPASEAAAGWGGDRVWLLTNKGQNIALSLSRWDTTEDAVEAQQALHRVLVERHGGGRKVKDAFVHKPGATTHFHVARYGRSVIYLEGPPTPFVSKWAQDIVRLWKDAPK